MNVHLLEARFILAGFLADANESLDNEHDVLLSVGQIRALLEATEPGNESATVT